MAVLVESISVLIRAEALLGKFPGGWEAFEAIVPNQTLCADNELVRVGFMTPHDVESFIDRLKKAGLEFQKEGEAIDIAVADQMRGFTSPCRWAEFGRVNLGRGNGAQEVAAARLIGSRVTQVVTPPRWTFEGSLSQTFGVVPTEHATRGLKFLRREGGLDIYLNSLTGKEVHVGRTEE